MAVPTSSRIRLLAAILAVLAVLAGAYAIAWFALAERVESEIAAWAEAKRAQGWEVRYEVGTSGFPGPLQVRLLYPRLDNRAWRWTGPDEVTGRIALWAPDQVRFEASGRHTLAAIGLRPQNIMADRLSGMAQFGPNGLHTLTLDGEAIAIDERLHLRHLTLSAKRQGETKLHLEAALTGLELPPDEAPILGRRIEAIALQARLDGPLPASPSPEDWAAWRDAGGLIEVEKLDAQWGDLGLALGGTAALDQALQPVAAFSGDIQGWRETLDAMMRARLVPAPEANIAKLVLGALSQNKNGRATITIPLTVQDGAFYVGPVKLARVPPIDWRGAP